MTLVFVGLVLLIVGFNASKISYSVHRFRSSLLFVGMMLLFMLVTQLISAKRARGEPVLPRRRRAAAAETAA